MRITLIEKDKERGNKETLGFKKTTTQKHNLRSILPLSRAWPWMSGSVWASVSHMWTRSKGPRGSSILWFTRWCSESRETSCVVLNWQAPPQSLVLSEEIKREQGVAVYKSPCWLLCARLGKTNGWHSSLSSWVFITQKCNFAEPSRQDSMSTNVK